MLNTQKLLYILPDVAYIAELLPGKKPTTYTIQTFRQINGEFLDDNEFLGENVLKLIQKLDADEYHLILPDFLFTNTIVNVPEKSDLKVKSYLKEKLLPELELTPETHVIDSTILTEHGDNTKVQLSALEKSVLLPIQIAVQQTKVKIAGISPISWTIKSFVSLEPSISVVQMGSMLYTALHYIGVDQTTQANVDEVENIFETIRTLKGAEPSIQTVYLLSNDLVEEKLKEHLSDTLPIQQLASHLDDDSKMPSYVQKSIEAGMRTLSIDEYPVPKFELGKAPEGAVLPTVEKTNDGDDEAEPGDLPKPSTMAVPAATVPMVDEASGKENEATNEEVITEEKEVNADESVELEKTETAVTPEPDTDENVSETTDDIDALLESLQTTDEVKEETVTSADEPPVEKVAASVAEHTSTPVHTPAPIIKNNNRTRAMLKMVFVTLAVFFATVGVGIGLGLGVLQLSQLKTTNDTKSPIAEASPTPIATVTPSPSPSPSPSPTVNKADMSVLVVNATTKAGYAGTQAAKLKEAGFTTIKSGNALDEYEEGNYVLLTEDNPTLVAEIGKITGLTVTFQKKTTVEDPKDQYDIVLVLAE